MLRRLLPAALVLATLAAFAAPASAAPNCLPDVSGPRWIDYATSAVGFRDDLFRRSGLTLALDDLPVRRDDPAKAFRDAGASEVYWDEHMEEIVGRPASPKPAAGIDQAVGTLVAEARTATGCGDPVVALNELLPPAGASGASIARDDADDRRRGGLPAPRRPAGRSRGRGVLQQPQPLGPGPAAGQPRDAPGHTPARRHAPRARRPAGAARDHARLHVGRRPGRPRGPAANVGVAGHGQAQRP